MAAKAGINLIEATAINVSIGIKSFKFSLKIKIITKDEIPTIAIHSRKILGIGLVFSF